MGGEVTEGAGGVVLIVGEEEGGEGVSGRGGR